MQISFGGGVGWDGHTMLTLYGRDRDNMDPTLAHQRKLSISVFRIVIVLTDQASLFFPVVSRLDKAKFLKLGIIGLKT